MRVGDFPRRRVWAYRNQRERLAVEHMGEREYFRVLAAGHEPMTCVQHGWVGESGLPCPVPGCANGIATDVVRKFPTTFDSIFSYDELRKPIHPERWQRAQWCVGYIKLSLWVWRRV